MVVPWIWVQTPKTQVICRNIFFLHFLVIPCKKIQLPANRTNVCSLGYEIQINCLNSSFLHRVPLIFEDLLRI